MKYIYEKNPFKALFTENEHHGDMCCKVYMNMMLVSTFLLRF